MILLVAARTGNLLLIVAQKINILYYSPNLRYGGYHSFGTVYYRPEYIVTKWYLICQLMRYIRSGVGEIS